MNENSSQTIKELSEDQEIKNASELDNDSASQNEEDLSLEKSDIPSADSSSSRTNADFDNAGFTQEEFASLLGKYDYNIKPGDLVKGTVFALEPKGAMIDIGAKTAAFMPVQEVSINRVEVHFFTTCSVQPVKTQIAEFWNLDLLIVVKVLEEEESA